MAEGPAAGQEEAEFASTSEELAVVHIPRLQAACVQGALACPVSTSHINPSPDQGIAPRDATGRLDTGGKRWNLHALWRGVWRGSAHKDGKTVSGNLRSEHLAAVNSTTSREIWICPFWEKHTPRFSRGGTLFRKAHHLSPLVN